MTRSGDSLKAILGRKAFRSVCRAFREKYDLPLTVCDMEGTEIRSLCEKPHLPGFCKRIRQSRVGAGRCRQGQRDTLAIAIKTNQPQITICHAGIVSGCVPIMDATAPLGGVFFGKCLFNRFNRKLEADVQERLKSLRIWPHEILEGLSELPVIPARKLHDAADFLHALIRETVKLQTPSIPSKSPHPMNASSGQPDHRITAAIDFMRYNYAESLTLAAIAYAAGLSVSRLGHLFVEQMGMTVFDYLNTLRIDHAKRLLKTTDANCTRIAYTVGFNSPAYFTRVFKKHTGQTPGQYRNKK